MRHDIQQSWHTGGRAEEHARRARRENGFAFVSRHAQAMRQIQPHLILVQRAQAVLERNALAQLTRFATREFFIQLRLAEYHDLNQLAFFGFQIAHQTQSLQRFQGHGLRLVDANDEFLVFAREQ